MNKVFIVDASVSNRRLMAGLLVKSGYEPIAVETMEAAKNDNQILKPILYSSMPRCQTVEQRVNRAESLKVHLIALNPKEYQRIVAGCLIHYYFGVLRLSYVPALLVVSF